ncbi:MAG TPA: hypothetical protein VEC11_08470 [Allosphingosinicella sp.]|nr:hypothetical protein [Allosphingosinicella sp.]
MTVAGRQQTLELNLQSVSIGPAILRQGRDYGLRTRNLGLSDFAAELLEDFALSLSEWAKGGRRHFEILFWLGEKDGRYALLKGAFLGPGGMGPIAVAQGVLIPEEVMRSIGGRAHHLLPEIPTPSLHEWEAVSMNVRWPLRDGTVSSDGTGPAPPAELASLGLMLASSPPPWSPVSLSASEDTERHWQQLLDAIPWERLAIQPSWSSTDELPEMGRFSLRPIALVSAGSKGGASVSHGPVAMANKAPGRTPLQAADPSLELLVALFDKLDPVERAALSPAALRALQAPKWTPGQPPQENVLNAIYDLLSGELDSRDFWDVLELVSIRTGRLEAPDAREAVAQAVTTFFSSTASSDREVFVPMLSQYIERIWVHLPGNREQPLLWALDRDVLDRMDPSEIRLMVDTLDRSRPTSELAAWLYRHADTSSEAGDRISPEAALALVDELNTIYEPGKLTPPSIDLLGAAVSMAERVAAEAPRGDTLKRLVRAVRHQCDLLMANEAKVLPGWKVASLRFFPRIVSFFRRHRIAAPLRAWCAEISSAFSQSPSPLGLREPTQRSPDAVAHLLVLHSLTNARLAGQPK